ncbi:MAG: T9SS type A sorting domain-containing protein [Bacteroidota bacterium]
MQNLYLRGLCVAIYSLLIPAHILAQEDHPHTEMYANWDEVKSAWIPTEKIERISRSDLGWLQSQTLIWDMQEARWLLAQTTEQWADAHGRDTAQVQQIWRQGDDRSWQQIRKQLRYHPLTGEIVSEKIIRETRTGGMTGTWHRRHFNQNGCLTGETTWTMQTGDVRFLPRDSVSISRDATCRETGRRHFRWEQNNFVLKLEERYQYADHHPGYLVQTLEERSGEAIDWRLVWTRKQHRDQGMRLTRDVWEQADGTALKDSFVYDASGRELARWQWVRTGNRDAWIPQSRFQQRFNADGQLMHWQQDRSWDLHEKRWTHTTRTENTYRPDGQLATRNREWIHAHRRESMYQNFVYRCDGRREMTTQHLDQGLGKKPWQQATFHYDAPADCETAQNSPGLSAFPNPIQHQVFLQSPLLRHGVARIQVADPAGRVHWQQEVSDWHASVFSIQPDLAPGIYLISVQQGDQRAQTKIRVE